MHVTSEVYVQRLIEISGRKLILLQDIYALIGAQSKSIAEEGMDALEKLLADSQMKMGAIDKLDEEFNIYFLRLKHELKISSLDELKGSKISGITELQTLIKQIVSLTGDIREIETQNNERARRLLNTFGDDIKKLNQGKKINLAYTPGSTKTPSYFIDKKK